MCGRFQPQMLAVLSCGSHPPVWRTDSAQCAAQPPGRLLWQVAERQRSLGPVYRDAQCTGLLGG
eukprot:9378760-Karenia_brevis.AAC.1